MIIKWECWRLVINDLDCVYEYGMLGFYNNHLLIVRTSGRKLKDCHVRTRYIIIYKLLVSRSSESADDEINKYRKENIYLFHYLLFNNHIKETLYLQQFTFSLISLVKSIR